jgi:hypothetical protein
MEIDRNKVNKYLTVFLLSQPIIDLITSLNVRLFEFDISFGMIVRFIFLILGIGYILLLSKSLNRKKAVAYMIVIAFYSLSYIVVNIYFKGSHILFQESKYLLKLMYFPILLSIFWCLLDEKLFNIKSGIFIRVALLYSIIILLAHITRTQFTSYEYGKLGHVGWFYAANEIGAIIAILSPFIIWLCINRRKNIGVYLLATLYIYSAFVIGTKVPFLGIVISITTFIIIYLIKLIIYMKNKDIVKRCLFALIPPFLLSIIAVILFFNSPISYNLDIHLKWLDIKVPYELLEPSRKKELTNIVFSDRDLYLRETRQHYYESGIFQKLFGIGTIKKDGTPDKLVEIDYYDIVYRNGIVGFFIYLSLFIYILSYILVNCVANIRNILLDPELIAYEISLILSISIAYFAGHVLTAPAVSIYVVLITMLIHKKLSQDNQKRKD